MRKGTDTFARQVGQRGYYAMVSLQMDRDDSHSEIRVQFNDSYATEFRPAAHFGLAYAWEQYVGAKKIRHGANVTVTDIQWQPVDTHSVLVAFAATRALWQALEWKPLRGPEFDEARGAVVFPKVVS